jgi:hypothetical protein
VIRVATPADAPAMIDMGRALALESPKYRDMTFDEAKLMALGERINSVLMSDLACSFVAERAGQVVGMMVVGWPSASSAATCTSRTSRCT